MSDAPPPGWGQQPGPPAGQGYPRQPPYGQPPHGQPGGYGQPPQGPPGGYGQPPQGQPGYTPPGGYGSPGAPAYGAGGGAPSGTGQPPTRGNGVLIGVVVFVVLLLIGAVGAVLLLRGGGDDDVATPTTTPTTADPGGTGPTAPETRTTPEPFEPPATDESLAPVDGTDQSVFELTVGTCFNNPESADAIQSVGAVPCETPHDNEVFALVDYPGGPADPFPGREPISLFAEEQCQGELFSDYVGIDYINSQYFASQLTPTEGSWDQGDREIVCLLYDTTSPITGSVQGSGR